MALVVRPHAEVEKRLRLARSGALLFCAPLFCSLISLLGCNTHQPTRERSTLTRVGEVRRLGPRKVGHGDPVDLTGVVTYRDSLSKLLVIQDPSGGIPVDLSTTTAAPTPGRLVRIEGVAGPGDAVPVVLHPKVTDLGSGRLPNPQPVS